MQLFSIDMYKKYIECCFFVNILYILYNNKPFMIGYGIEAFKRLT